jgi:hypothetical protein
VTERETRKRETDKKERETERDRERQRQRETERDRERGLGAGPDNAADALIFEDIKIIPGGEVVNARRDPIPARSSK